MKKLIAAVVVVLIAIGGYAGVTLYKKHKFFEAICPHVKNSSLRLSNSARYETEKETKITFSELFGKLEADIAEIDKRILEVQTIATPSSKEITDPVLDYMKDSQELLRTLLTKYRKMMALKSADNWANQAVQELRTTNYYGFEYAKKASDKSLKDLQKAIDGYEESILDVIAATKKLKGVYVKVAASLPGDTLVDPAIFEAIEKKNELVLSPKGSNTSVKKK